ncbi:MAG: sulfatase-like hydrolase/transferase, partial [Planctomycetota bacterium]
SDLAYYCVGGEMDYFHYIDNVAGYNLFRDGRPIRDVGYFTDRMTQEALQYIRSPRQSPYFLYLPYTCPHAPFQGPQDQQPHPLPLNSRRWKQGAAPPDVYVAMIQAMDTCIGEILDAVDGNTLVIFTSDNGGTGSARNKPFRGQKGGTFEGGIRVPAIARWPGKINAGSICDTPCMTFDFTKTIADAAGVLFPDSHPLEGENLLSILAGNRPKRTLYWRKPRGDQVWKGVRAGNLKYVAKQSGDREQEFLFDLERDQSETQNLIQSRATDAARLRRAFERWEHETRRQRRGRPADD